ncbi:MAG TPA: DUF1385 domain-containing protein [Clostridiales bacterium]|nr:DUF1385 domain-containing protein [Clostridiales bacterium]HXK83895.1 DUF1385 domain-containing protein [Clostridiales bacterium]
MKNKKDTACPAANVGGQALLEGIMMNGPLGAAMSVRMPDGRIYTKIKDFVSVKKKYKILNLPIIRGVVTFIESMVFGYKCLMESAELSMTEEELAAESSKLDKWLEKHLGPKLQSVISAVGMVLGVLLSVALFLYLPSLIADLTLGWIDKRLIPLVEGLIRIAVFILYIYLTSKNSYIKRVYMYHGAEHKSIFCYEAGKPLTVENVKGFKRFHPRCGTSFIFVVLIVSILIFTLVLVLFPNIREYRPVWVAIKLLATPLIMGIGYEFIRLAGKYQNPVTKLLSAPGLLMQRLTTLEPTDDIIEVGIAALKAVTDEECCKAAKAAPKEKKTEEPEEPKEKEETPAENAETPQESIEAPESPQENEAESV